MFNHIYLEWFQKCIIFLFHVFLMVLLTPDTSHIYPYHKLTFALRMPVLTGVLLSSQPKALFVLACQSLCNHSNPRYTLIVTFICIIDNFEHNVWNAIIKNICLIIHISKNFTCIIFIYHLCVGYSGHIICSCYYKHNVSLARACVDRGSTLTPTQGPLCSNPSITLSPWSPSIHPNCPI